jgi:hypothetical protein
MPDTTTASIVEFKVSLTEREVALLLFILADSKSDTTSFLRTSVKNYWTQAKQLALKLRAASGEEDSD